MANVTSTIKNGEDGKPLTSQFASDLRNKAENAGAAGIDKAKDMASSAVDTAKDTASSVANAMSEAGSTVGDKANEATSAVGVQWQVGQVICDHPEPIEPTLSDAAASPGERLGQKR